MQMEVVLLLMWFATSLSQEITLEQIQPVENICLGDDLVYECTVQTNQLIWEYTGNNATPVTFFDNDFDRINQNFSLGPFAVVLTSIDSMGSDIVLTSTAIDYGVMADVNGQSITCLGHEPRTKDILFANFSIMPVSVCMSTISWNPPPCGGWCTVSLDENEVDTFPCSYGGLTIAGYDSQDNGTLSVNGSDALGRNVFVSNESIEVVTDCGTDMYVYMYGDDDEADYTSVLLSDDLCSRTVYEFFYSTKEYTKYSVFEQSSSTSVTFFQNATHLSFTGTCEDTYYIIANETSADTIDVQECIVTGRCIAFGIGITIGGLIVVGALSTFMIFVAWKVKIGKVGKRQSSPEESQTVRMANLLPLEATPADGKQQSEENGNVLHLQQPGEADVHVPVLQQQAAEDDEPPVNPVKVSLVKSEPSSSQNFSAISSEKDASHEHPVTHCVVSVDQNNDAICVASADSKGEVREWEPLTNNSTHISEVNTAVSMSGMKDDTEERSVDEQVAGPVCDIPQVPRGAVSGIDLNENSCSADIPIKLTDQ